MCVASLDHLIPFTSEELENLRTVIFPSMPSYRVEDGTISSANIANVWRQLNKDRSEETIQEYVAYWDNHFDGRASYEVLGPILEARHSPL